MEYKSWPFLEAKKILDQVGEKPKKGYVLFETGYGPSGMPHIGTFGEVARTTMVIRAFKALTNNKVPVKLICFSDDMDGLRKVPENIPNKEMISRYIDFPLSNVPDPFSEFDSYAAYMNNKLKEFLDRFSFEYELISASSLYKEGKFNHMLEMVLAKYKDIMDIMLPSLGPERRETYSPIMPISPSTGKILQTPMLELHKNSVVFKDTDGKLVEQTVLNGHAKLQWKPDFAMRWACLGVDYEMYGKEHRPNTHIYSNIARVLGGKAPLLFFYELFLDEKGGKISKSKGNGIEINQWLKYAPIETLMLYMYQSPNKAKRLHFDVIPKAVDEYIRFNNSYLANPNKDNPCFVIHGAEAPEEAKMYGLSYSLLLNLVSATNVESSDMLWKFVRKYAPGASREDKFLSYLIEHAINYYHDFIVPKKVYMPADDAYKALLQEISDGLISCQYESKEIQNMIFNIGKAKELDIKEYFENLYKILLGMPSGPKLGSLFAVMGRAKSLKLISDRLLSIE